MGVLRTTGYEDHALIVWDESDSIGLISGNCDSLLNSGDLGDSLFE